MRCASAGLALLLMLPGMSSLRADAFDEYTNPILDKALAGGGLKEVGEITPELITDHDGVLPNISGTLLVIRTNQDRWSKLLVKAGRQKVAGAPGTEPLLVPVLRVERYVTYREATERAIQAEGKNLSLFAGFQLHLDLGQVVPDKLGGDLVVAEPKPLRFVAKPLGKAKAYVVAKPLPGLEPGKSEKFQPGSKFEAKHIAGTYRLFDDGRRAGTLRLKVNADNDVTGTFISDRDGAEYEVRGAAGNPAHKIRFTIKFPQTEPSFEGYVFTGDARAMAGVSKLIDREAAFYAVRVTE
jgi:hypothetical protein